MPDTKVSSTTITNNDDHDNDNNNNNKTNHPQQRLITAGPLSQTTPDEMEKDQEKKRNENPSPPLYYLGISSYPILSYSPSLHLGSSRHGSHS